MAHEDVRKPEIGEIRQNSFDSAVITWKIYKVSSVPFKVDYAIQSPPFSFDEASWILKIYFNGQTKFQSEGNIDIVVERLNSQVQNQEFLCKVYCKNVFEKEVKPIKIHFRFHPKHTRGQVLKVLHSFELTSSNKWEIVPNDILTVVWEIQNLATISEAGLLDQATGLAFPIVNTGVLEVSEIQKCSYQLESVTWRIPNASSLPSPEEYLVQSPPFSFANASWTLKLFPFFQIQGENKQYIYVALQRLHSQIPEHFVFANVCFFADSLKNTFDEISRSYIFNSNNVLSDVMCFTVQKKQVKAPHDIFSLVCKFRTEKKNEKELGYRPKSDAESTTDLSKCKVLRDFRELYLKQTDCDVIIKVKGQQFPAHQAFLKARSPVLCSTFQIDMKEKATGVVEIKDCDPSSFSDFLCFLYCGEVENLSSENVFSLFTTADKYDVVDLRSLCLKFIKENLSVDTFCDTISLALLHSEAELIELSTDFFAKNIPKIILTVKWQTFLAENPTESNELFIKALIPNKNSNV